VFQAGNHLVFLEEAKKTENSSRAQIPEFSHPPGACTELATPEPGIGMKRLTGDIDILEPFPKSASFYRAVKDLSKSHNLDPKWINDGVKGFLDDLSPDCQKRLIPLNETFENLHVFIISKPDLITMKICAWREADKEDFEALGISQEDLTIINSNLAHVEKHSPDRAHKAHLVLSELGVQKLGILVSDEPDKMLKMTVCKAFTVRNAFSFREYLVVLISRPEKLRNRHARSFPARIGWITEAKSSGEIATLE
jgi:hypothetical protein